MVETGTPLADAPATFPSAVTQEGQPGLFDVSAVRAGDGLAVTFRDVTEAVEQAEQLRRSERRFRLLSQNTNDLVLAFENDVIQWASPFTQDLLGYTPEELIGRDWASFSYGDGQDLQALDEMNVGDVKIRARTRIRAKDGSLPLDIGGGWTQL